MINILPIKASEIANIIGGTLIGKDRVIKKISIDSREKLDKKTCFWGIKGKKYDGNNFIEDVVQKNPGLIVSDREINGSNYIFMPDTNKSLETFSVSRIKRTKIIAITGSLGKTTVKNMIISVLAQKYKVCGTLENQNNEIGTLLSLAKIKNEDFCVLEMGMRGLGEIEYLTSITYPETAIITNISTSHIGELKSIENIFLAKCEILKYNPKYAILPSENRFYEILLANSKKYYVGNGGDFQIYNYKFIKNEIIYSMMDEKNIVHEMKIYSNFLHNIHNSLFAYVVGKIYGVSKKKILKGLLNYKQEKLREEYKTINGINMIIDCYNSSYESLKSALYSLVYRAKIMNKNACALLGDMLELGEFSAEMHEKIASIIKELKIKKLFYIGEYSKIIQNVVKEAVIIEDLKDATNVLKHTLSGEDLLLVKASRGMNFESIVEEMKNE